MKRIFFIFTLLLLISTLAFASDDKVPDMEQEILRQLEQIKCMGNKWDAKLEEAQLQTEQVTPRKQDQAAL